MTKIEEGYSQLRIVICLLYDVILEADSESTAIAVTIDGELNPSIVVAIDEKYREFSGCLAIEW